MSRYFEFKDEKSNKFWSVSSSDKKMSIHYGKIGTAGQKLDKEFESAEEAVKETEKAISKKLKEGYAGSRYFCERFFRAPARKISKNYATANACGCPDSSCFTRCTPNKGCTT